MEIVEASLDRGDSPLLQEFIRQLIVERITWYKRDCNRNAVNFIFCNQKYVLYINKKNEMKILEKDIYEKLYGLLIGGKEQK